MVAPRSGPGAVLITSLSTVLPGVPSVWVRAVLNSESDGASFTSGVPAVALGSDGGAWTSAAAAALPEPADAASGRLTVVALGAGCEPALALGPGEIGIPPTAPATPMPRAPTPATAAAITILRGARTSGGIDR